MRPEYERLLPALRSVAEKHGYALGFHGSGQRDLDLIAVPWIEEAGAPEVLVEDLRQTVNGVIFQYPSTPLSLGDWTRRNPQPKPHGRLAWSIHFGDLDAGFYIDLSVMPLQMKEEEKV